MSDLRIGIVGAGVIGLTTALELQNQFRNAKIEVCAEKFREGTTSHVAAGVFRPGTAFAGPSEDITRKWITDSYNFWENLRNSPDGAKAGVTEVSGYIFSSAHPEIVRNRFIEKLVPIYRSATEEELKLCPGHWKYGSFFSTVLTDSSLYLPWTEQKFLGQGGKITERKVDSLGKFGLNYDVIVNCSGLGAKQLCNDHSVVPIRGQVFKVKAPWIKNFFYGDYDTYILPGYEGVTLGGCRQYESYDLSVNKYMSMDIWERCTSLVPSLKGAEVIARRVGLRPHRSIVRVEKEIKNGIQGRIKVVHNYGHGGYGVTTAPGTVIHACSLVREVLTGNSKL